MDISYRWLQSLVPGLEAPPPVKFVKRIRTIKTTAQEAEAAVNAAVTVGKLTRNERGEIVRAASTAGPGYCPT